MSTVECFPIEPRSPEWHQLRSLDLTASDLGAACGDDPYKTPLALYMEKTGQLLPQGDNPMMRRGRWLEGSVITALREAHPDWSIDPLKVYLRDPEHRLGATPDAVAITGTPGLKNVQLKVVAKPEFIKHWDPEPPLRYLLQTLAEGYLMEASGSILVALVLDAYSAELFEYHLDRNDIAETRILDVASRFWKAIDAGQPPPVMFDRDAETIAQLYPVSVAEPVLDLTGDNLLTDHLIERDQLKDVISQAEARIDAIDTEIKAKMGAAERAELPGWKLSNKTQHRKEYTVAAKSFRRLVVTRLDEQEKAA